jgi:hypothetical protein
MTHAAAMPIPGSTVDQMAMSTDSYRKSRGKSTESVINFLHFEQVETSKFWTGHGE